MQYQHSAIKGAKVTLPSVEGGFGTLNILRDPPKSLFTRYIPKVSDTNRITEMIDESGDRVCEGVKRYARGVNQMVSVSYSNNGTSGGQYREGGGRSGTSQDSIATASGQSYLPYRIMRDGAFRPPVVPPEQLLPLSRLPRITTSQYSNPGSDMVQKYQYCGADLKSLRQELLKVCAEPKVSFNIERPHTEPSEVKNMILMNRAMAVAQTNRNDPTRTVTGTNQVPTKEIKIALDGSIIANKSDQNYQVIGTNVQPDRGIKDVVLEGSMTTNLFSNLQTTSGADFIGNQIMPIQDRARGELTTVNTGVEKNAYIHDQITLDRNIPITSAFTNTNLSGVDMNSTIQSRDYTYLQDKPSYGGFVNSGYAPNAARQDSNLTLKQKSVYQLAAENSMAARNNHNYE